MNDIDVNRFCHEFQVEGLLEGEDFAAKVSRDEEPDKKIFWLELPNL